jgi:hypothetical protein
MRAITSQEGFVRAAQDLVVFKAHMNWDPLKHIPKASMPRAIMVIRHPFKCILSEFTRQMTKDKASLVTREEFDKSAYIAFFDHYGRQWNDLFNDTRYYGSFIKQYPEKYLVVKYEDLTAKALRIELLSKMVTFAGMPKLANDVQTIKCAFAKAELPTFHRGTGNITNVLEKGIPVTAPWVYQDQQTTQFFWDLVKETATLFAYTATNY